MWNGGPIEILFGDIAKSWLLNDTIVEAFFPHLIPDRSIVIQQDLVFHSCPWIPITMEALADYFEPVAFVEYNSVVYVCRRPVPPGLDVLPVGNLSLERKVELLQRAIERFRGYPRGFLELALVSLLRESGDDGAGARHFAAVQAEYQDEPPVMQAIATVPGTGPV